MKKSKSILPKTLLILPMLCSSSLFANFTITEEKGKAIAINYEGKALAKLMTENDSSSAESALRSYKVYLNVMNPLEENQRLTKGDGFKFPHHRGIYIGWSKTKIEGKNYDTWHMRNGVRQEFQKIISQEQDENHAKLSVAINWVSNDEILLSEQRDFVFTKPSEKGAFLIDKISTITAVKGDTELAGDREHAGCQFRANEEVVANKSAQYIFADGKLDEKTVKKRSDLSWAAMQFKLGEKAFHVQHMSHPSLPKPLIYSAYRNYGRFGAYMVQTIKKSESFSFKFRFYVSPGEFPDSIIADSEKRFTEYSKH